MTDLLNAWGRPRHLFWGGYPDSERRICVFPADWQEEDGICAGPEGPLAALEARFPPDAALTHRDVLGALMGLGLNRELLGDILLPQPGLCQVVALRESLPILLSQWEGAGRWRVSAAEIALDRLAPRPAQVKTIRDTVATPRLDAGDGRLLLPVPGEGRRPDRRGPGVPQSPGMPEGRPPGGRGRHHHLPGAGQVCGQGGAGTVQKGTDYADY